ncbi:hypothetical protein [Pseudoalteromonas pernae]|uniref:hypothetical protein n=1 Tax=Pseudoalteromonas pernae TaxID=3118054 RepID=UPI003242BF9E
MLKRILWLALLSASSVYANNDVIMVDRVIVDSVKLAFPNDEKIQPDLSDFVVDSVVLMSNEEGERWAVVTVSNQVNGLRTMTQKHLNAVVANGQRISPSEFSQVFKANETLSLTVYFGHSKFPLLDVHTRTE